MQRSDPATQVVAMAQSRRLAWRPRQRRSHRLAIVAEGLGATHSPAIKSLLNTRWLTIFNCPLRQTDVPLKRSLRQSRADQLRRSLHVRASVIHSKQMAPNIGAIIGLPINLAPGSPSGAVCNIFFG